MKGFLFLFVNQTMLGTPTEISFPALSGDPLSGTKGVLVQQSVTPRDSSRDFLSGTNTRPTALPSNCLKQVYWSNRKSILLMEIKYEISMFISNTKDVSHHIYRFYP